MLIILFCVFASIPFLPESILYVLNRVPVYAYYNSIQINVPISFRYIKDVILILLILLVSIDLLMIKRKKIAYQFLIISMVIIIYGALSLAIEGNFNTFQLVSGIRPILLLFTTLM